MSDLMNKIHLDVNNLKSCFHLGKIKSYEQRLKVLKSIQSLLQEGKYELIDAVYKDLHKHPNETDLTEIMFCLRDVQEHIHNLYNWINNHETISSDLFNFPSSTRLIPEPLGVICIISAWNYPIQLTFLPLIGAISSGNCVLLRLPSSEHLTHTPSILEKLINKYINNDIVRCATGGRETTSVILTQKYDKYFFTGGTFVGKMVARAAAENLTPTILELGGKSPLIVDGTNNDFFLSSLNTAWAGLINSGQTCIRPDYVMVHVSVAERFVNELKKRIIEMFGNNIKDSTSFGRIVTKNAYKRIINLLSSSDKYIVFGDIEKCNEDENLIVPFIVDYKTNYEAFKNSELMKEEIFGPILPVYYYENLDNVIEFINSKEKPLTLYMFSNNQYNIKKVCSETSSGSVCVNDCIIHLSNSKVPFGGVGNSGMGSYHGKNTFLAFSHLKPVTIKKYNFYYPFRYPPYSDKKHSIISFLARPSKINYMKMKRFFLRTILLCVALISLYRYKTISKGVKTS